MKHLKKYKVFESNTNFYWEGASESIDIITRILNLNNIKFKHTFLTDEELENIDGDHNSGSELYSFEFIDLDGNVISICIASQEKDDVEDDDDDFYIGISVLVLLFNDNTPNVDGIYLESGKDLMKELSKLRLPLPTWIKKINGE